MNRRVPRSYMSFLLGVVLACAVSQEAGADYRAMMQEMDGYLPPAAVAAQLTAKPASEPITPASAEESAFASQVEFLQQQQSEWRQSLTTPEAFGTFYRVAPGLVTALQPAVNDPLAAEKALATGFTLETLEALVMLRSPAVQAKESELRAVLDGYSQVENLDTLLRRYASLTKSLMTGVGGMTNGDPVSLKFPFPGVLSLKGEVVNQESLAAREELEAAKRDALTSIRKDYAELVYNRKAQDVTQSLLRLIDNLDETISARYQAGTTNFQDVTGIGIKRETAKDELATLVEEQANVEASIRAALALPVGIKIGAPASRGLEHGEVSLESLYNLAVQQRQEVRGQQAMIGRMERMLEMAETMVYPGLSQDLSLFDGDEVSRVAGEFPTPVGAEQTVMEGTAGGFPVVASADVNGGGLPKTPWFGTNDAYLRQTRQRIESLKKELDVSRAATLLEVRLAWFRLDKAKRQQTLYRDRIVILAQANLDASSQGYSAGRVSFAELIESASSWLAVNLGLARAGADVLVATAELDAAVGITQSGIRAKAIE